MHFSILIYDVWFNIQDKKFSTDLVKDECLADGAPLGGQGAEVEDDGQDQHHDDSDGGVEGADEEAHHYTADQAQGAGVPGEVLEGRPVRVKVSKPLSYDQHEELTMSITSNVYYERLVPKIQLLDYMLLYLSFVFFCTQQGRYMHESSCEHE